VRLVLAGAEARDLAAGMLRFRAGSVVPRRGSGDPAGLGLLAQRSTSGLAPARAGARAGLLRQRSTGLVRSPGRPGESCPWFGTRWSSTWRRARSPLVGGKAFRAPVTGAGC